MSYFHHLSTTEIVNRFIYSDLAKEILKTPSGLNSLVNKFIAKEKRVTV